MDIKNLVTFIHVAELNSFTKTAEVLGYSQSTVSFQIKQLETELKAQLFERINHTVVLTEKGREVLKYAHQISKMTQELRESIQAERKVSGKICLALADSLCGSLLREGFGFFRERYPGMALKIITAGTEEMFRLLNHNDNTKYVIAKEEKAGVHFVAGQGCPLLEKASVSIHEIIDQPFILTESGMSYRRLMDEKLAGMSLEIQPILEIGRTDLICMLVEQGAGISFLPDYVTAEAVKEGRLFYLDVEDFGVEVWKQLLYHRDKWVSPQMESLLEYCIDNEFSKQDK